MHQRTQTLPRRTIHTVATGTALTALVALSLAAAPLSASATTLIPNTVTFTAADVIAGFTEWTVPSGVTTMTITAVGANGGTSVNSIPGGLGAVVQVAAAVTPGTVLTIAVGSVGDQTSGGVPGGGQGYLSHGGGGFSGVLIDDDPIVIAGAGGGGGVWGGPGGNAGAAGGDDGGLGGQPGTSTGGGAGGAGAADGFPGAAYQGGTGGGGFGAGGGAGYFGGGGGGANYGGGGGGGGSSYPFPGDSALIASHLKAASDPAEGTVTLEFDRFAYEVQFDTTDGATTPTTLGVYIGDSAEEPLDPTRAGFAFEGWYTHPTGGDLWDFTTIVTTDLSLYAQWSSLPGAPGSDGLAATGPDFGMVLAVGTALAGVGALALLVAASRRRPAQT